MVRCKLKMGTEFELDGDRHFAKRDYYTMVDFNDSWEDMCVKAKANIQKQIAKEFGNIRYWVSIWFDIRHMETEWVD